MSPAQERPSCGRHAAAAPHPARSSARRSSPRVAYIDPGNFATNIAAGSKFGYTLVWVIVAANLMAMLIQTLSAKLGIATGPQPARGLPRAPLAPRRRSCSGSRRRRSRWRPTSRSSSAPRSASTCSLGIPLFPAAVITGVIAVALLGLQRFGFRPLEVVITVLVLGIGGCYLAELFYANPPLGEVAKHAVVPQFAGNESVLLAVGILGATVMPHVIYLHSALTQNRIVPGTTARRAA